MGDKSRLKLNNKQVSELIELYQKGWFMKDLSRKFNVSSVTVKNYLKRNGVTLKDPNKEISRYARSRKGSKNPFWKGGKTKRSDGYILIRVNGNQRILEHRHVMEIHLGRKLETDEHVHHINGIKDDNRIENLELMTASGHTKLTGISRIKNSEIKHYIHVEKEELKRMLEQGKKMKEICEHYGFSKVTFYNKLENLGLKDFYMKGSEI